MRAAGINWLAVIVAAVAVYAIGFIIYGVLISDQWWMAAEGVTEAEIGAVAGERMPFGPLLPLVMAAFTAVLFRMGNVASAIDGIRWGAVIALASAIPALWYGWVYGVGPAKVTLVDSGHLLLGHVAAGAILGGWK